MKWDLLKRPTKEECLKELYIHKSYERDVEERPLKETNKRGQ